MSKPKTKKQKELEEKLAKLRKQIPKKAHKGVLGGAADDLKIRPPKFSGDKGIRRSLPKGSNRISGFGTV